MLSPRSDLGDLSLEDGLRVGRRAVATFVMVLRMAWTAGTMIT